MTTPPPDPSRFGFSDERVFGSTPTPKYRLSTPPNTVVSPYLLLSNWCNVKDQSLQNEPISVDDPGRAVMNNPALHILLVDEQPAGYDRIRELLAMAPRSKFRVDWVRNGESALREIASKRYDACLVDSRFHQPGGQGIVERVLATGRSIPVILLARPGEQEADLSAIQAGAADTLIKDEITPETLDRSIRYAIERKRAEESLRRSEAQLKGFSSQLLAVHESERKRVALELHDSLGQLLSAVKFGVESTLAHLERGTIRPGNLESLVPMIQQAIEEVRRIYTTLRPTMLDDLGIVATLNWYCREFSSLHPQLSIDCRFDIDESLLAESVKVTMYRLVQEAFERIATRSRATQVRLIVQQTDSRVELTVEDNGAGSADPRPPASHWDWMDHGFPGMKERTELSGGTFHIDFTPAGWTRLTASWSRA